MKKIPPSTEASAMNHGHVAVDSMAYDVPVYILAAFALTGILILHLLPALFAGLLVHQLIHMVARKLRIVGVRMSIGKIAALTLITTATILALVFAAIGV